MADGDPEGTPGAQTGDSAPQSESAFRESIIAHVSELTGRTPDGESETSGEATGDSASDTAAPSSTGGDATPPDEAPPLSDPAAFQSWLDARDAKRQADFDARMENQRKSLTGSFQAERQRERRQALLGELDGMDPVERDERLRTDPEAAQANAERAQQSGGANEEAARTYAFTKQAPLIFNAASAIKDAGGPDIEEVFGDAARAAEIAQRPNGVFGWLVDTAIEHGGKAAVEKYKNSAEYKNALEDARQQAVRDAFPGMGAPPARGSGTRPASTTAAPVEYDDPRAAAVAAAARRTGRTDIDPSDFVRNRRRVAA